MKSVVGAFVYVLGLLLAGFSALMPANEYYAVDGFMANDCDGGMRILLFLVPGTLFLTGGTILLTRFSPLVARRRISFVALTLLFWLGVLAWKAWDFHLHYACS